MYPFFGAVSVWGIGILVWCVVFLSIIFRDTQHIPVIRKFFFAHIGRWGAVIYIISAYIYYALEEGVFIPLHRQQIVLYLSPFGFHFHAIGIILGLGCCTYRYAKKIPQHATISRTATWFDAYMSATIAMSPFLVLSDQFFGIGSKNRYSLAPLTLDSDRAIYEYVLPLGIYVGILSACIYGFVHFFRQIYIYKEYLGYGFRCFGMMIITLYQVYPRHGVLTMFNITRDIRQYVYILLGVCALFMHRKKKTDIQ